MKKRLLILSIFLTMTAGVNPAISQTWQWAKSAGGVAEDVTKNLAIDSSGNSYITGYFWSPTIIIGSTTLINADNSGVTADMFLAKYDANGNVLWAKRAGGSDHDRAMSVAVDASGSSYVTGDFSSDTIIFGSTILTLTNPNNMNITYDMFLAKYDSNGNVLWAKNAAGAGLDAGNSVKVDASGNGYLAGEFQSYTLTFGTTTLMNTNGGGGFDTFLAKYDANGNVLWAKRAMGASDDRATSVAVDAFGNTYLTGEFRNAAITFGSATLSNIAYGDIFLAKYDSNGNVLWAKSAGGSVNDWANFVAVDTSGNSYVAGWFDSPTLIFGSTTLTNGGNDDMFLAKYDVNGNVLWAKGNGGASRDLAKSVAVDMLGNSYLTGGFQSSILTFGSTTLTNNGSSDLFLAKYDANGNVLWAKSVGSTDADPAECVEVDASGNLYLTGAFRSPTLTFGSITLNNTSAGAYDLFLSKMNGPETGTHYIDGKITPHSLYPNPFSMQAVLQSDIPFCNATLSAYNSLGQIVIQIDNLFGEKIIFYRNNLPSGLYFIRITQDGKTFSIDKLVITDN